MAKKIINEHDVHYGKSLFKLNQQKDFNPGDRVKRVRKWSENASFYYGGFESSTPMGAKGIVRDTPNNNCVIIEFDLGIRYQMHPAELDLLNEVKIKHKIKW